MIRPNSAIDRSGLLLDHAKRPCNHRRQAARVSGWPPGRSRTALSLLGTACGLYMRLCAKCTANGAAAAGLSREFVTVGAVLED